MCLKDFSAVFLLYLKTFPAVDDADFVAAWQNRHCSSAVYFSDTAPHTLVGFGLVAPCADYPTKLWFLAVDPAHRGGGTGTRLLNAIKDECKTLALCPVNEAPIIEWYKRHGFVISRTMPFIHHDIPVHTMVWKRCDAPSAEMCEVDSRSSCTSGTSTQVGTPISRASYGSEDFAVDGDFGGLMLEI